jgi:hypothetical protein
MQTNAVRNPNDLYFEYHVIAGPWKGLKAKLLGQPAQSPEHADFELRAGKIVRGPFRLPLNQVRFRGPRTA